MKKIAFFTVTIISLMIIKNLVFSIYNLLQKENFIKTAKQELTYQAARNRQLKDNLKNAQSKSFIEKEARDKLLLVKPGEQDILISRRLLGVSALDNKKKKHIPNWKAWLDLFF
ncbi:MAG: septum formation initiator family protein [Patescibacteria group bacterium]|nr:septum formation initiator family protein [Patescibacteria group bacterium]